MGYQEPTILGCDEGKKVAKDHEGLLSVICDCHHWDIGLGLYIL